MKSVGDKRAPAVLSPAGHGGPRGGRVGDHGQPPGPGPRGIRRRSTSGRWGCCVKFTVSAAAGGMLHQRGRGCLLSIALIVHTNSDLSLNISGLINQPEGSPIIGTLTDRLCSKSDPYRPSAVTHWPQLMGRGCGVSQAAASPPAASWCRFTSSSATCPH